MDRKLWEQLPVYRKLENEIKRHISEHHLKRHDRLPSESQLAREYNLSIGTVRKALNNLVTEKIIYRRHGQGTFVSPRSRKERILIVPTCGEPPVLMRGDYFDFLLGALDESLTADLPCEPALVRRDDFFHNLDNIKMFYPETAGVIFFRGHDNLLRAQEELHRQKLPCLFYGPNIYGKTPGNHSTVYHDETQIAVLLAECYAERGFRRALILHNTSAISGRRVELLTEECRKRGILAESRNWHGYGNEDLNELHRLAGSFDVFSCTVSGIAIEAIQVLERMLGLRVPDAVAVTGVDNPPAAEQLHPELTVVDLCNDRNGHLCLRRFSEALGHDSFRNFHLSGALRLIRRESC